MRRSRRELSNEYLLAKIGVDTTENELLQVLFIIIQYYSDPNSILFNPNSIVPLICSLLARRQLRPTEKFRLVSERPGLGAFCFLPKDAKARCFRENPERRGRRPRRSAASPIGRRRRPRTRRRAARRSPGARPARRRRRRSSRLARRRPRQPPNASTLSSHDKPFSLALQSFIKC